ncbi:hypothetical protein CPB85DRAFT_1227563 [Mucidula mucida]|nr:hypothetical protein CPB85DRAFT_1227563 [Mucidula mucida]
MSSPQRVALIIGAGPNIGDSVAHALLKQDYKVAVGSRTAKRSTDAFYPFTIDITKPESIKAAFDTVAKELGPPNVVVFNGNLRSFSYEPANSTDPLTMSLAAYTQANTVSASFFAAAKESLASFRLPVHGDLPKAMIVTGNLAPFLPVIPETAVFLGLAVQKKIAAYLMELCQNIYGKEGLRFHYAHLVASDGGIPPIEAFLVSGPAHAKAYMHLINASEPEPWDYRQVLLDGLVSISLTLHQQVHNGWRNVQCKVVFQYWNQVQAER